MVRIVDRGDPSSRTVGFGAMELYAAEVVGSDPFQVARTLREAIYDTVEVATIETRFPDRESARRALPGAPGETANRFFRAATSKCVDFRFTSFESGGFLAEFFAPANTPGYGKRYVQQLDPAGVVVRWYKETWGPEGLIETKWLKGEPP